MAYPVLPTSYNHKQQLDIGRELERATNGALRGRQLFTAVKSVFSITHPMLDATDLATFKAHYASNLALSFTYVNVVDGVSYTCVYGTPEPSYSPEPGGRVTVSATLMEI